MNIISWLLYFADVAQSLRSIAGYGIILSGLLAVSIFFAKVMQSIDDEYDPWTTRWRDHQRSPDSYPDPGPRPEPIGWHTVMPTIIAAAVCSVVLVFVPQKNTVYAIAASEMGEEVLRSKTANKAMTALNAWLDRQIAGQQQQPARGTADDRE